MTQRFKITIEYDGGNFVGWQAQDNGPSVQVAIEDAIHAFSGERLRIITAGRTDAGVHARGQVSHFDLQKKMTAARLQAALNAHLRPNLISILSAQLVPDDFNARFSATKRHYLYRILNRRAPLALARGRAWQVAVPLDAEAMNEAAKRLVGRHDFTTFRAAQCQAKSPEKTLDALTVERPGEDDGEEILIRASAQSFLHNQVRSMVGTLKMVGEGKWTADDVTDALEARDRARVGFNAPPEGLYLMKVDY